MTSQGMKRDASCRLQADQCGQNCHHSSTTIARHWEIEEKEGGKCEDLEICLSQKSRDKVQRELLRTLAFVT